MITITPEEISKDDWSNGVQVISATISSNDEETDVGKSIKITAKGFCPEMAKIVSGVTTLVKPIMTKVEATTATEGEEEPPVEDITYPRTLTFAGDIHCSMTGDIAGSATFAFPAIVLSSSHGGAAIGDGTITLLSSNDPELTAQMIVVNCIGNGQYVQIWKDVDGYHLQVNSLNGWGSATNRYWIQFLSATMLGEYVVSDSYVDTESLTAAELALSLTITSIFVS